MPKYLVIVKADHNDADYTEMVVTAKLEDLDLVRKVAVVLNDYPFEKHQYNWAQRYEYQHSEDKTPEEMYKDYLTPEEVEIFQDTYVPMDENCGVHTIKSIRIIEVANEEQIYAKQ